MLLALVAVALFLVSGASAAPSGSAASPALQLRSTHPLVVRGTHFAARERVRVAIRSGETRRARMTSTSATGVFRVAFDSVAVDRCTEGLIVTAAGARDRATLKLPRAQCPPA